jgi:4-hydroxy-3-methylbut-2-enyl diphosphate reductase
MASPNGDAALAASGTESVGSGVSGLAPLTVLLAEPRGFCAGVERAIEIVERALAIHGAPVYVRHEIVHNRRVVRDLERQGAIFVEQVAEIPEGAVTVFSAHGVARKVERDAAGRELQVIDATCPLVAKVHKEAQRFADRGREIVLIGHAGHPEVEGTLGRIDARVHLVASVADVESLSPADPAKLAYVTQTTLSLDDTRDIVAALEVRFPGILGPNVGDICYATQNRQTAARALAAQVDAVLVVGAENSSNSNRLREVAEKEGVPSFLVHDPAAFDLARLGGARVVGITAGASAPEVQVQELLQRLGERYALTVRRVDGVAENVHFRLPPEVETLPSRPSSAKA